MSCSIQARAFIPDGYTQDCYISELTNIHEAVRFQFRPVLPESVRTLMHNFFEKSARIQGQIIDETLQRQLIRWDLCDHEGNPVELTVKNLQRIKKPLKDRLFNIVTCYEGGDTEIDTAGKDDTESEINFDELLAGESDGTKTEVILDKAKN